MVSRYQENEFSFLGWFMRIIVGSLFTYLCIVQSSFAFTAMNFSCPEKYQVKVKTITPFFDGQEFERIEVSFDVLQVFKGEEIQEKTIRVVKGGPTKFVVGDVLVAEFNDHWLCKVEESI